MRAKTKTLVFALISLALFVATFSLYSHMSTINTMSPEILEKNIKINNAGGVYQNKELWTEYSSNHMHVHQDQHLASIPRPDLGETLPSETTQSQYNEIISTTATETKEDEVKNQLPWDKNNTGIEEPDEYRRSNTFTETVEEEEHMTNFEGDLLEGRVPEQEFEEEGNRSGVEMMDLKNDPTEFQEDALKGRGIENEARPVEVVNINMSGHGSEGDAIVEQHEDRNHGTLAQRDDDINCSMEQTDLIDCSKLKVYSIYHRLS